MRYFLILFLLICSPAWSATQLKKVVAPSGGDYTSLEAAVNANEQNLVTADKYLDVEISGTWSSADTTAVTVHNYTTDATRYINIYTTGSARHDGTYYKSGAYKLTASTTVTSSYTTIDGITASAGVTPGASSGLRLTVKNSIFNGAGIGGSSQYNHRIYLYNNIFMNVASIPWPTGPYYPTGVAVTLQLEVTEYQIFNNTFFGCNSAIGGNGNGNALLKNNLVYSTVARKSGDYTVANISASSTNNLSSDATAPALGTYYRNKTLTFTNTTAGSEDFHLVSTDTDAIDKGTDLSGTFTTDIINTSRPQGSAWDIGAFEYVSSGTSSVISILGQGTWDNVVFK